ncbi:hypothetical protein C8D77_1011426 [Mesorhizobium loti]|uniref:Uncharacterized protein n=1 Tax=Rhizobium loti TaxID=381 RepID=A0A8E2WIB3_RHILI|nr:hypothetical protein [Mesorhizobium loti]PWJ94740.1 hypothetical protein C8D77_1011426 [Mesorhizobium loti]
MKNFILSALVAISVVSPTIVAPAQAASLVITTDNGDTGMGRHHWRRYHDRDHHWRGRHDRHCFVKVRKQWRHHHWVIQKVRICDFDRF